MTVTKRRQLKNQKLTRVRVRVRVREGTIQSSTSIITNITTTNDYL